MKEVAMMLKAIHSQECKSAAREKATQVAQKLRERKLSSAAKKLEDGIDETLTYMDFPRKHWSRIRTNNTIERLNREIKRRIKAIGVFTDGQSASMLVCARLRHVAGAQWGVKRYMNMDHLYEMDIQEESDIIAGYQTAKINLRKIIDTICLLKNGFILSPFSNMIFNSFSLFLHFLKSDDLLFNFNSFEKYTFRFFGIIPFLNTSK